AAERDSWVARPGGGGLAEDFRIGAAQVVAVEQGQVNELTGENHRRGEFKRVGGSGSWDANQLRVRPRRRKQLGRGVVANGNLCRCWIESGKLGGAGEQFAGICVSEA